MAGPNRWVLDGQRRWGGKALMAGQERERFGNYVLQERIGVGGMAEIFLASADVDGARRPLVIKRILSHLSDDDAFVRMFIEEAKLCVLLRHPNVVQVYDLGVVEDQYFIAMEYVEGRDLLKTLAACARQRVAFPTDLALYIVLQVLKALDYAHNIKSVDGQALDIIHRDVSPPNVLLSYSGDIKLSDFGIAKASFREKTQTGIFKGKFGYMSPEQAMGEDLDHRSDLFAVGILMYELLTGHRLFTGPNEVAIIEKVRTATIKPPLREYRPDISDTLHNIVMKSLARRRDDRFYSADELHEAIYNYTFQNGVITSPRTLARFMNRLFPENNRQAGEPVVNEASWSNASSILYVSDSRILSETNTGPEEEEELTSNSEVRMRDSKTQTPKDQGPSATIETNVEDIGQELRDMLAASSKLASASKDYDDDGLTHEPTPFGGVPVLNFDSTAHNIEILSDDHQALETIQGDEELPNDERTSLVIDKLDIQEQIERANSELQKQHPKISDESDELTYQSRPLQIEKLNLKTQNPTETSLILEDSSVFREIKSLPDETQNLSDPFGHSPFNEEDGIVEKTTAEPIPSSLLELIEEQRKLDEQASEEAGFDSLHGTEEVVEGLAEQDSADLPTSLGALDQLGSPEEVAQALGLEEDDPPQENSTGVRAALSEAAQVEEEIKEFRRASMIESKKPKAERTAMGELVDFGESDASQKPQFWAPSSQPSEDGELMSEVSSVTNIEDSSSSEPAFLQNNETIERNILDEEAEKDIGALPLNEGGRLQDRGASDLFGALDLLDDEESIGAFPSSFDGTDLSLNEFSDQVSAIVRDPAIKNKRKEILAPSVIAAQSAHSSLDQSIDEETANSDEYDEIRVKARKTSSRIRPSTPVEKPEDQTPYAPGSLVPESRQAKKAGSNLPGFIPSSNSQDFNRSPSGLLSDSYDIDSDIARPPTQNELREIEFHASLEPEASSNELEQRQKDLVRNARPIMEKRNKLKVSVNVPVRPPSENRIPQADTRTFPGEMRQAHRPPRVSTIEPPRPPLPDSVIQESGISEFHTYQSTNNNYLVWGFVLVAAVFAATAAMMYLFDADSENIRRAIGLLDQPERKVLIPKEVPPNENLDLNPQVVPAVITDAGLSAETQAKEVENKPQPETVEQKQEEKPIAPSIKEPVKPKIKRAPAKKPKRKIVRKKKRSAPKKEVRKKRSPRKKIARKPSRPKPLERGKGGIRWKCQKPVNVRITRVGNFKQSRQKRVQVRPGNYRVRIQQDGGSISSKFIRVIAGEITTLPCN